MKKITVLSSLIKAGKFDYVNSDITGKLFPVPKEISADFKLFDFGRYMTSEDAIKEMTKEGYRPANIYELLSYDWNGKDWIAALGSVVGIDGSRGVPCLDGNDSGRDLSLDWWGRSWGAACRFLAVRNLSSDAKASESVALGNSDALPLELAIKQVKEAGYVIYKKI